MYNYLEDIPVETPDDFDGKDVTPVVSDLFQVNKTYRELDTQIADLFNCTIARFLYVLKRARPDLQVTVSFLCKRVKAQK